MNENKERRRRHTFPVRRQKSYDHNLYVRELYKSYILAETAEPSELTTEPSELTEQTERVTSSDTNQASIIERHYFGEFYSYTSSNPNSSSHKSTTTIPSSNRLPRPQSRNDHDRSRSSSPFCRNIGKEVTDNFLFGDNISTNFTNLNYDK